jgi:hypothetical protein
VNFVPSNSRPQLNRTTEGWGTQHNRHSKIHRLLLSSVAIWFPACANRLGADLDFMLNRKLNSRSYLRKPWSCGFAARCAVGPSPTGGDPSTSIGLRPNIRGHSPKEARGSILESRRLSTHQAAQPLRPYSTKPNRSVPSIRGHSPIGCTMRNPIGQFPEATDAQARPLGRAAEPRRP